MTSLTPRNLLALCLLLVLAAALAPPAAAAPSAKKVRVIVEFDRSPGKPELAQVTRAGGRIDHRYRIVPAVAARVPEGAISSLRRNPRVASVERDGRARALDYGSGTRDWGIAHLKADLVHGTNTGVGARVAVLDTGIDCPHLELDSNCTLGPNYVAGVNSSRDDNGHGTHVAGAVAAERNAGVSTGVVGMAPGAGVVAYKVLDSGGYGYWSDIAAAIDHVWQTGSAQVINMSLGGSSAPSVLQEASNRAYGAGILVVAAAGNGGNCGGNNDSVSVPAAYDSVVAVAAVDKDNNRPCWSATGPQVELSAPGVSTFSTWPGALATSAHNPQPVCENSICHYKYGSGTSMSAPHAAGAAALVLASGTVSDTSGAYGVADEVRTRLQQTAVDLGSTGRDGRYGYGLIDALAATGGSSSTPNSPPTARFTYACTGLGCSFDGSGSSDSDGSVASYHWDFGDGSTATGATASHTYAQDGAYTVVLTVTDDDGATDTESAAVSVSSEETAATLAVTSITPNAIAVGTTAVTVGGSGFVSGSTLSFANGKGPNPTAVVTGVSADGQSLTADVTVKSSGPSGASQFDVVVQNPNGTSAVLAHGLTVTR